MQKRWSTADALEPMDPGGCRCSGCGGRIAPWEESYAKDGRRLCPECTGWELRLLGLEVLAAACGFRPVSPEKGGEEYDQETTGEGGDRGTDSHRICQSGRLYSGRGK